MKKILLSSALALSVMSGSAMAATETGSLTFNWQAVVPSAPLNGTNWAFVDGQDIPFIPASELLKITRQNDNSIKVNSLKPFEFFIAPVTGKVEAGVKITRNATKTIGAVQAFLASTPISNGLAKNEQLTLGAAENAGAGEISVVVNNHALKLGVENPVEVVSTGTAIGKAARVTVDMNADIPEDKVIDGAGISFNAPVIFQVDI
ncbi:Cro/Cl family transcriptional regulator [Salmonella enterica]|nr:Cro/Cl family transcriptional regulator [Salmonella enterica]ELW8656382.1 Cro/Cl family transcriptional regulator [Salmonella enterica]